MLRVDCRTQLRDARIQEVKFEVAPGEVLALVASDCVSGRGAFLQMLAGLPADAASEFPEKTGTDPVRPDEGRITFGKEVWFDSESGVCLSQAERGCEYQPTGTRLNGRGLPVDFPNPSGRVLVCSKAFGAPALEALLSYARRSRAPVVVGVNNPQWIRMYADRVCEIEHGRTLETVPIVSRAGTSLPFACEDRMLLHGHLSRTNGRAELQIGDGLLRECERPEGLQTPPFRIPETIPAGEVLVMFRWQDWNEERRGSFTLYREPPAEGMANVFEATVARIKWPPKPWETEVCQGGTKWRRVFQAAFPVWVWLNRPFPVRVRVCLDRALHHLGLSEGGRTFLHVVNAWVWPLFPRPAAWPEVKGVFWVERGIARVVLLHPTALNSDELGEMVRTHALLPVLTPDCS